MARTFRDGGELLVATLEAAGVDTVFGVISVHNLPLIEAVDRAMRFVPVRHEAAAVNAADGYARARGGLGCAITSTGTGAGNAAGALIEALAAGSPVLHVTGQVPSAYFGSGAGYIHDTKDQLGMLAAVSASAGTMPPDGVASVLGEAVHAALGTGRVPGGPVSIEWPIDGQYRTVADVEITLPSRMTTPPVATEIDRAAALLASARRPAIWAGGGTVAARLELLALVERLSAALFTSNAGRGVVPEDHPLCIGNYGASSAGAALLAEADVVLSIGTHFRSNETRTYKMPLPACHIQVDLDPAALGRTYPAELGIVGDAADVLTALDSALGGTTSDPSWRDRVVATRERVRADQRSDIGPYAEICDAIAMVAGRRGPVARDVTIPSSSWGNRLLPMYEPGTNIFARGGGIGQGLAMGIGAALARPDEQTVVIAGDGGLSVHLGELLTLAQERPRLALVVFNDFGYGVLRNMQHAQGRRPSGVDLHTPDFAALAAAVRIPHARLDDAGQAAAVLADAAGVGGPVLVEVDVAAVGPMPKPFVPPVEVPS